MDADLPFAGEFPPPGHSLPILDAQASFGLWIGDRAGRVRPLSDGFLELAGLRLEASRESGWKGRLRPEEARETADDWKRCRAEGLAWEREFRLADESGRLRHVISRGRPVVDAAGRIRAWVGLNLDVTDVRESGGELRRARERVLLALSSGGDYLYEADPAAGTRRWFGPVEDLLGLAPGALPGSESAWAAAVHPEDRAVLERAMAGRGELAAAFLPDGRPDWRVEYRLRRSDGGSLRILDRGRRVPGPEGHPGYCIGIVTDLTKSVQAGETARRGEERRKAGQRMEVIGRLAGGIAHDFNNLLTAINGFSELLVGVLEDEGHKAYAQEILRAGERAALITRQLLAFSRRQILAPRVVDLNLLARHLEGLLPGMFGEGLAVVVKTDPQGACIKADPAQVEQIFVNLASHARDGMPQGGRFLIDIGRAETAPASEDASDDLGYPEGPAGCGSPFDPDAAALGAPSAAARQGPYVVITVTDEGEGLDEEAQGHLFEPFFPAHGRPHGLGLSAVYGIVKQNGGHIVACSQRGQGTTFRIHWPRWTGEVRAPLPETPAQAA